MNNSKKSSREKIFKDSTPRHISLTIKASLITAFSQLLQSGFWVKGIVECSIQSFLCEHIGLAPEYLEKRIQTIFLDGQPVDNVETATLRDGATLSLSAAMPGLAGAILRRGGYYAPMRDQISFKGKMMSASLHAGKVFVKLFNLPLQEVGPLFLERGVWIDGNNLKDILTTRSDDFRKGCRVELADGRQFDPDQLLEMDWGTGEIFLQVKTS
jgi:hypothetical protein